MNKDNISGTEMKEAGGKAGAREWVKFALAMLISCIALPIGAAVLTVTGTALVPSSPTMGTGVGELMIGLIAILAIVLLGGKKCLRISGRGIGYALRISWPILAVDLLLLVLGVIRMVQSGKHPENMLHNLLGVLVLCIGVGIFEEADFCGIMLNGVLAPLGKSGTWVLICSVAVSLWFGSVHVGKPDAGDTTALILAVLKILQAGIFGIVVSAILLRTKELGGAVIIHLLHDFMLMSGSVILGGTGISKDYTNSAAGSMGYIAYAILIAVSLYPLILSVRAILGGGENHGAFIPEDGQ